MEKKYNRFTRLVHGTYFSVPSYGKLCLSHPIPSHRIPILILIWNIVQLRLGLVSNNRTTCTKRQAKCY